MTSDEWGVIKAIAAGALAQPDAEREAYVAAQCGDESLRREVESLLAAVEQATALFEEPGPVPAEVWAVLADADHSDTAAPGERFGAYRIVSEIGRGGMGAAYMAERADRAYEKRVAIKLIKRGMDTDAILQRFRHERQILANLEHPHIVTLLDGGTTAGGLPYFVMEYVDGLPIDRYCELHALSIPARLKLFIAVCDAVEYAHQHRVVHRDLKPSNILVTTTGVPKLLDFGIARLLDAAPGTQAGEPTILARAMTPQFASPEQIRGEPVTASTDVYSLGVLLYVLLTGRHPYRLEGVSARERERIVCEMPPPRPSQTNRAAAGDLDAIVRMAMRKEPQHRYGSAKALGEDVQRHLEGAPVAARAAGGVVLRQRTRAIVAVAALLIMAIAAVLAVTGVGRAPFAAAAAEPRALAVLPLVNAPGDADLEYLSDGITEDVISRLSRAPRLKVIARESVYRYKGRAVDPGQVARELGVDAILSGTISQRGGNLSVTVELVDTQTGQRLWADRYDRVGADLQRLQRELAQQIATRLRLQFTTAERAQLARPHTGDGVAYELYLKGRYFWNKRTANGFDTSVSYFTQAVARDPSFALAYSGLADAYSLLTEYHARPAAETYPKAKAAALRALSLDPLLPEAHASLAYVRQFYEWDWRGAEEGFTRAIALNPNYATGYQWYAEYLSAMGRHDEALAEIRKAQAVDPLSLIVNAVEANLLYMAGHYDQAIDKSQQVIDLEPNFAEVYEFLKRAYDQKGLYREAIAARQARRRILGRNVAETPALRAAAAATSARSYWRQRLAQEREEAREEGLLPFEFAEIHAQAGDTAGALDWLERACREHDFMTMYVRVAPNLAPLRSEPRYLDLVRRGCRLQGVAAR